jgi:hypothetical protein
MFNSISSALVVIATEPIVTVVVAVIVAVVVAVVVLVVVLVEWKYYLSGQLIIPLIIS